mgnify:CR=1 FL=1
MTRINFRRTGGMIGREIESDIEKTRVAVRLEVVEVPETALPDLRAGAVPPEPSLARRPEQAPSRGHLPGLGGTESML